MWSGAKEEDQTGNFYGVAICAKTELVNKGIVSDPNCYSDRIMSVVVHGQQSQTTFVSCYAPTLNDDVAVIETFYHDLKRFLNAIPNQHNIILAGEFNARVGTSTHHWGGVIGHHGIGR
jgi:Endonuclease/Exonuclease/phosphatase family.